MEMTNVIAIPGFVIFLVAIAVLILVALLMRKSGAGSKEQSAPSSAPIAVNRPVVTAVPPVGAGNEVIAVISAAVVAYMDETAPGVHYAITRIAPRPGQEKRTRPIWGFAGVSQNTEPF